METSNDLPIPIGLRTAQKHSNISSASSSLYTVQKPNVNSNKLTLFRGTPETLPETPYNLEHDTPFSSSTQSFDTPILSFVDGIFSPVGGNIQHSDLNNLEQTPQVSKISPSLTKPLTSKRMMIHSLGSIARTPSPKKEDFPRLTKRDMMMAFWEVAKTPPRKEKNLDQLYEEVSVSTIKKPLLRGTVDDDDDRSGIGRRLHFAEEPLEMESNLNGVNYASKYLEQYDDKDGDEDLLVTPQGTPLKQKVSAPESTSSILDYLSRFDDIDEDNEDLLASPQATSKDDNLTPYSASSVLNYLSQFEEEVENEDDLLLTPMAKTEKEHELIHPSSLVSQQAKDIEEVMVQGVEDSPVTPLKDQLSLYQSDNSNYALRYLSELKYMDGDRELSLSPSNISMKVPVCTPTSDKISYSSRSSPESLLLDTSKEVNVGGNNFEDDLILDAINMNKMRAKVKPNFTSLPDCAVTPDNSIRSRCSYQDNSALTRLLSSRDYPDSEEEDIDDFQLGKMRLQKPNLRNLPDCDVTPSTVRSSRSAIVSELLSPLSNDDSESEEELEKLLNLNQRFEEINANKNAKSDHDQKSRKRSVSVERALGAQRRIEVGHAEKENLSFTSAVKMIINSDQDDASEVSSLGSRSIMSKSTVLSDVLDKATKTLASLDEIMHDFKRIQQAAAIEASQYTKNKNPYEKRVENMEDKVKVTGAYLTPVKANLDERVPKLSPVVEHQSSTSHKDRSKAVSFSDNLSSEILTDSTQYTKKSLQKEDQLETWCSFEPPKLNSMKAKRVWNGRTPKNISQKESGKPSVDATVLSEFEKLKQQINITSRNAKIRNRSKENVDNLIQQLEEIKRLESDRRWNTIMPSLSTDNDISLMQQRPPIGPNATSTTLISSATYEFNENRLWFAEYDKDGFLVKNEEPYSSLLKNIATTSKVSKQQIYSDLDPVRQEKKIKKKKRILKKLKKLLGKMRKSSKDEGSLGIESIQSNMTSESKKKRRFQFLKRFRRNKNNRPSNVAIDTNIACDVSQIDEEDLKKTLQDMNMAFSDLDIDSSDMSCSGSDMSQDCSTDNSTQEDYFNISYACPK